MRSASSKNLFTLAISIVFLVIGVACNNNGSEKPQYEVSPAENDRYTPLSAEEVGDRCRKESYEEAICKCLQQAFRETKTGRLSYNKIKSSPRGILCLDGTKEIKEELDDKAQIKSGSTSNENPKKSTLKWTNKTTVWQGEPHTAKAPVADSDNKGNQILSWIKQENNQTSIVSLQIPSKKEYSIILPSAELPARVSNFIQPIKGGSSEASVIWSQKDKDGKFTLMLSNHKSENFNPPINIGNDIYDFHATKDSTNQSIWLAVELESGIQITHLAFDGTPIDTPQLIPHPEDSTLSSPILAVGKGNQKDYQVIVVYKKESDTKKTKILAQRYDPSEKSWRSPIHISKPSSESKEQLAITSSYNTAKDLAAIFSANGNAHFIWSLAKDEFESEIWYASLSKGAKTATEAIKVLGKGDFNTNPQLIANQDSSILMLWREKTRKQYQTIRSAIVDNKGNFQLNATRLDQKDLSTSWYTQAKGLNDQFLVTWCQWSDHHKKYVIRSSVGNHTGWQKPTTVHPDHQGPNDASFPFLSIDPSRGEYRLIWRISGDERTEFATANVQL